MSRGWAGASCGAGWRTGIGLWSAVALVACGEPSAIDDSELEDAPTRLVVDHIPANPPGGRWIEPSSQTADFVRRFERTGEMIFVGAPLARLMALAFEVHPGDVVVPEAHAGHYYDGIVKPPPGEAARTHAMLRDLLHEGAGWSAVPRRAEVMGMVLAEAPDGFPLPPSTSREGSLELEQGKLTARGVEIAALIELLRRDVKRPIVDESGLTGHYDFVLQWDPSKGAYAFLQALGDIGLTLEAGVREVERLVVVRVAGSAAESAEPK